MAVLVLQGQVLDTPPTAVLQATGKTVPLDKVMVINEFNAVLQMTVGDLLALLSRHDPHAVVVMNYHCKDPDGSTTCEGLQLKQHCNCQSKTRPDTSSRDTPPATPPAVAGPVTVQEEFSALESITRSHLTTKEAAFFLNRRPQTLRVWACHEDGPLRPVRVNGYLAWPVSEIKRVLGSFAFSKRGAGS